MLDLTGPFRRVLERCGAKVNEAGTATVDVNGAPHFHGWNVELRGASRVEMATMTAWCAALLSLAGAVSESAAE